jgi:predicted ATP-dependent protease
MTGPERLAAEACTARYAPEEVDTGLGPGTPEQRMRPQARALQALRHGIGIRSAGFNVAVVGPRGTGRTFIALAMAAAAAAARPTPGDLVLLPNPRRPLEPRPAVLPARAGPVFVRAMEDLHGQLEAAFHDVLEGNTRNRLAVEVQREQSAAQQAIRQRLIDLGSRWGLEIRVGEDGFEFHAFEGDGEATPAGEAESPDQLGLPGVDAGADTRPSAMAEVIAKITPQVEELQRELTLLEVHAAAELRRRQRTALRRHLDACFASLPDGILSTEEARFHVRELHAYLGEVHRLQDGDRLPLGSPVLDRGMIIPTLLTTAPRDGGAPLVYSQNPSLARLFGRVVTGPEESRYPQPGTILPGDVHQANGGFLVVNAEALLKRDRVYEHLKSCLVSGTLLPLEEGEGQILRPHPLPLDLKVILTADPDLLAQLQTLDPEFPHLFKIRADFAADMSREDAMEVYPRFTAWLEQHRGLPRCDASAIAVLLKWGARLAEDQGRASAELGRLGDIVTEAAWMAGSPPTLSARDIDAAIAAARERDGLLRERVLHLHEHGSVRVQVSGHQVGQINGLSVVSDGFAAVGRPLRVTAVTYAGRGGPFAIDREVELSGPLHDKGVLILAGWLAERFAALHPLDFGASVVFEQSYTPVEGDSASMAELVAILSSLAAVPARQDIAITGSVDQGGKALPVGGVNEKIEGFFDLCATLGLTGSQGVALPRHNVRNLVLRADVVEAIAEERFHVWAIDTVDDAVELLLGLPAETAEPDGASASVYGRIRRRLDGLRRQRLQSAPRPDP